MHRISNSLENSKNAIPDEPFVVDLAAVAPVGNISEETLQRKNGQIDMKEVTNIYNRIQTDLPTEEDLNKAL